VVNGAPDACNIEGNSACTCLYVPERSTDAKEDSSLAWGPDTGTVTGAVAADDGTGNRSGTAFNAVNAAISGPRCSRHRAAMKGDVCTDTSGISSAAAAAAEMGSAAWAVLFAEADMTASNPCTCACTVRTLRTPEQ